MKPKKCKSCGNMFTPERGFQKACSPKCAISLVADNKTKAKAKEWRKEKKAKREQLKSRSDWLKEAQTAFNKFIRLRDKLDPCISCGRHHEGQYHAGHYRSVGSSPELRFEELNNHKQCAPCNNHLSGNIVNYRPRLIDKIGLEKVEWIEGPHDPKKYSIEEIKAIKAKYTKLAKELETKAVD